MARPPKSADERRPPDDPAGGVPLTDAEVDAFLATAPPADPAQVERIRKLFEAKRKPRSEADVEASNLGWFGRLIIRIACWLRGIETR